MKIQVVFQQVISFPMQVSTSYFKKPSDKSAAVSTILYKPI
jgi:hypothetical protein